ncbi:MAG: GNAT family N-acetyltransferase [Candidatus Limnocylindria bacterium]
MTHAVSPLIETDRLKLVWLDEGALAAIVRGDRDAVERAIGAEISEEWVDEARALCALRLDQMRRVPADAAWLLRAVVLTEARSAIGQAGFHGAPGINGLEAADAVELGYSILAGCRGRGYATEAARGLMDWAASDSRVRRVLASTAPTNAASIRVVQKLGFVEVTRVWDEEDGEEIVFERRIRP